MDNRTISLQRAAELKSKTTSYKQAKQNIPNGLKEEEIAKYNQAKARICEYYNVSDSEWDDYKWQLKNRISDVETLKALLDLSEDELKAVDEIVRLIINKQKDGIVVTPTYALARNIYQNKGVYPD